MGRVIDAETAEPIEGAVVYMQCNTSTANIGGANTHYADAVEVLTDDKGEFHIELRVTTFKPGHAWSSYQDIIIFKPGYGAFPEHKEAKVDILVRDTSHYFPENTYVIISLPKLKTKEERKENVLYNISLPFDAPKYKWKELARQVSFERTQVGLKP